MKFIYSIAAVLSVAALAGALPVANEERGVAGVEGVAQNGPFTSDIVARDETLVLEERAANATDTDAAAKKKGKGKKGKGKGKKGKGKGKKGKKTKGNANNNADNTSAAAVPAAGAADAAN